MKSFYLLALLAAVALALTPLVLLEKEVPDRFAGKMVVYDIYGTKINSVDPATCGDVASSRIQANFYEGLYGYHYLKRPLDVVPVLAAKLPTISEDGRTYTIRLKTGVRYARNPCFGKAPDGRWATRTVRAEDFVLAFKRIADYHITTRLSLSFIEDKILGLPEYRAQTRRYHRGDFSRYDKVPLPGVRALDEHTLRIRLVKPFPQMRYVLAMHVYAPVPREVVTYHLAGEGDGRTPIPRSQRDPEIRRREAVVGTGPYRLTEWVRAAKIVMERNPDFREEHYPSQGAPGDREAGLLDDAGRRVPIIDAWDYTFVQENNPAWELFKAARRDMGTVPDGVFRDVVTPDRKLTGHLAKRGVRTVQSWYPAVYWIAFNMQDEVLGASKALRQAICLAYDAEAHVDVLYNSLGKRALTFIPSSFAGFDRAVGPERAPYFWRDLEKEKRTLEAARASGDAEAIRAAADAFKEAHKAEQARALAAARKKTDQARRELVEAGVLDAGEPIPTLVLDLGSRSESSRRLGAFARLQFKQIGLDLKVVLNDWPTLQQKVGNKQVQMYYMGWHADYPDAENFLQLWYSPNIPRGTNDCNFKNAEYDRLYEKAAVTLDADARVNLYVKMLAILSDECPCLPVNERIRFQLVQPWVRNIKPHPIGYGFGRYQRIDVDLRRTMGGR